MHILDTDNKLFNIPFQGGFIFTGRARKTGRVLLHTHQVFPEHRKVITAFNTPEGYVFNIEKRVFLFSFKQAAHQNKIISGKSFNGLYQSWVEFKEYLHITFSAPRIITAMGATKMRVCKAFFKTFKRHIKPLETFSTYKISIVFKHHFLLSLASFVREAHLTMNIIAHARRTCNVE